MSTVAAPGATRVLGRGVVDDDQRGVEQSAGRICRDRRRRRRRRRPASVARQTCASNSESGRRSARAAARRRRRQCSSGLTIVVGHQRLLPVLGGEGVGTSPVDGERTVVRCGSRPAGRPPRRQHPGKRALGRSIASPASATGSAAMPQPCGRQRRQHQGDGQHDDGARPESVRRNRSATAAENQSATAIIAVSPLPITAEGPAVEAERHQDHRRAWRTA